MTLHITALQNIANISELIQKDLNFLKQYIFVFIFFSTELMFSFQFSLLPKPTPKYLVRDSSAVTITIKVCTCVYRRMRECKVCLNGCV